MNLTSPISLWWLALAVPVVVFYILKIRLKRVPVSTVIFWQQIFDEKKPRSLWQKLRHLLSLLVQLALLALLAFALAEPYLNGEATNARRVVLIIDNSASMNAVEGSDTRLSLAKREALAVVRGLGPRDEMAVVAAGTQPRVASGLTGHKRSLRDAVEAIVPTDGPTALAEAVALANRLGTDTSEGKDVRVVVVTDACGDAAKALAAAADVKVVLVGSKQPNLAITRFQARRSAVDPIGYEILAEVRNLSDEPAPECRLDVALGEGPDAGTLEIVPLKLGPNEVWSKVLSSRTAAGGRLTAKLTTKPAADAAANALPVDLVDALAADNSAFAFLPKRDPQPVALASPDRNLFLRMVLEANPLVNLTVAKEVPAVVPAATVKIFHRVTPAVLPPGPVIVIDPANDTDLWKVGDKLANPIITKQDKDAPEMANVRLDNVLMPEAKKLTFLPAAGKPIELAAAISGDAVFAKLDRPGGPVVVLTVNLDQGDLPLRTVFPILMTNVLGQFAGGQGELRESQPTGGVSTVSLPAGSFEVRGPDGAAKPLPGGGPASVGPFDRAGVWTVAPAGGGAAVQEIAVNLMNSAESDLRPAEVANAAPDAASAGLVGGLFGRPVWWYLTAAAAAAFVLEWFLYQRRYIG